MAEANGQSTWTKARMSEVIHAALRLKYKMPDGTFTSKTHLFEDLDGDSLRTVEICIVLEEEFDVEVSDATLSTWMTVGNIEESIWELLTTSRQE